MVKLLKMLWEDTIYRSNGGLWGAMDLLKEENYMLFFLVWKNSNATELSLSHPGYATLPQFP